MTWYLPFKISIAKTDVFAIECLDQTVPEPEPEPEASNFSDAINMTSCIKSLSRKRSFAIGCLDQAKHDKVTSHCMQLETVNMLDSNDNRLSLLMISLIEIKYDRA